MAGGGNPGPPWPDLVPPAPDLGVCSCGGGLASSGEVVATIFLSGDGWPAGAVWQLGGVREPAGQVLAPARARLTWPPGSPEVGWPARSPLVPVGVRLAFVSCCSYAS